MSEIPMEIPSALNLTLHGSAGTFRIATDSAKSLEVKYFLTNVGLALGQGTNDALLSSLAPVREVFPASELDFDELMQRDIDDARVTSELIPYLLETSESDLVKLFPPIVVMLLPIAIGSSKPARLYPEIFQGSKVGISDIAIWQTRSGKPGSEVFSLEQPGTQGPENDHDRVRLHLNTHATRLVIVDGQHRAMALLAVHRNLREDQWADARRRPYQEYYAEWSIETLGKFDLKQVQLPVMICTIPQLDESYVGDMDLVRAARNVFLTLNKTARKVSESRNRLLDDADLMAVFMRRVLETVKQRGNISNGLRIAAIELDQVADRSRLSGPLAITAVSHVYYIIEHLMLSDSEIHGIIPRGGRFAQRNTLVECGERLDAKNLLGKTAAANIRRFRFTTTQAVKLSKSFQDRYGAYLVQLLDDFRPFAQFNKIAHELEDKLLSDVEPRLAMLLFGGQGQLRVFREHSEGVAGRLKDIPATDKQYDKLYALLKGEQALEKRIGETLKQLDADVTAALIEAALGEGKSTEALVRSVRRIRAIFTTVAFQASVMCSFFGEIERVSTSTGKPIDVAGEFSLFIEQLSDFFAPTTGSGLERLVRALEGNIVGSSDDPWLVAENNRTFRSIVWRREMQPDQWPKYRYLLLELWNPKDSELAKAVSEELLVARQEVVAALFASERTQLARAEAVPETDLPAELIEQLGDDVAASCLALWAELGAKGQDADQLHTWIFGPPTEAQESAEPDEELDSEAV